MGEAIMTERTTPPAPPVGEVTIFPDVADSNFKQIDSTGTVKSLVAAAGLPVVDTTSIVSGSADATKQMRFEVDGLTTATTRVMTIPDRDIILVDRLGLITGGDDPFVAADIIDAAIRNIRETDGPTTLLVGAVLDGQYPRRSGTDLVGDDAIPTTEYAASLGETTETGTSFVEKLKLTFTPSEASDWDITFSADVAANTGNRDVNYQFQEDDTDVLGGGTIQPDPNNGGGYISVSMTIRRTLTLASHDFDIDFSSSNAGSTVKIRNATIRAAKAT